MTSKQHQDDNDLLNSETVATRMMEPYTVLAHSRH